MKKNALLISAIFIFLLFWGGGTALFSQSLNFNNAIIKQINTNWNSIGLDTVPSGKIWKIERCINNSTSSYVQIRVDGTYSFIMFSGSGGMSHTPYWLPAGTALDFRSGSGNGTCSILEFNLTP